MVRRTVLYSLAAMVEMAALQKGGCRLVERSWRQRGYASMIEEDSWVLRWTGLTRNKADHPGIHPRISFISHSRAWLVRAIGINFPRLCLHSGKDQIEHGASISANFPICQTGTKFLKMAITV